MDKIFIKNEIQNLVEAITEQSQIICAYDKTIPQIEIDIIKVNIRDLYNTFIQLDKINSQKEKPIAQHLEKKAEQAIEVVVPIEPEIIPEIKKSEPEPEPTQFVVEKAKETPIEKPEIKHSEKLQKKTADLFSESPTMADKFKNDTPSLNEKIAMSKTDASLVGKINQKAISDIKMAIGINEKFRFVNELFDGNLAEYNDGIAKLNNAGTFENAQNIMTELTEKYKWVKESATYTIFNELVNRRFV